MSLHRKRESIQRTDFPKFITGLGELDSDVYESQARQGTDILITIHPAPIRYQNHTQNPRYPRPNKSLRLECFRANSTIPDHLCTFESSRPIQHSIQFKTRHLHRKARPHPLSTSTIPLHPLQGPHQLRNEPRNPILSLRIRPGRHQRPAVARTRIPPILDHQTTSPRTPPARRIRPLLGHQPLLGSVDIARRAMGKTGGPARSTSSRSIHAKFGD